MYKWTILLSGCLFFSTVRAQDVQQLRETARSFQRQGDYENAILVLTKAASLAPKDPDVQKDLGTVYYISRQYPKALEQMKPLLDRSDADEQVYQIVCLIYRAQDNLKEADRLYKVALKKYPSTGMLYSEYGDLLELKEPGAGKGIEQWENGIKADPEYPNNYYHATKYYLNNTDNIWGLLYGEIFVNLESFTGRTAEVKNLLLSGYKKLFVYSSNGLANKTPFATDMLEAMKKQTSIAGNGVTAETLTAIRTRFILEWDNSSAQKYPFHLFELHRELLQEGLFESYNQWLFGSVDNISIYQNWTATHSAEYADFNKYQRNRIFKMPAGQYYSK